VAQTKFLSPKNELDTELVLHTMAAYPDDEEAINHLKEHHGLTLTTGHLASLRYQKQSGLQKARESLAVQQERALISDLADNARQAGMIVKLALRETRRQLEAGEIRDPSRVARDAADAQAKAIDKSRLLQQKPTVIVHKADTNERWRLLQEAIDADTVEAHDVRAIGEGESDYEDR
jgi:hypothetical protein